MSRAPAGRLHSLRSMDIFDCSGANGRAGPGRSFESRTPVLPLMMEAGGEERAVFLKLEGQSPAGSSKYRTAWFLLEDLERKGRLSASSVIVESTSGNLGVALALLCRERNLRFLAVIDPNTTEEYIQRMRALGAGIEIAAEPDENQGYLFSRLRAVKRLCASSDVYVWPDQYGNPVNPLAHCTTTAPEIREQVPRRIDAIFVAVSTGGTLAGIARHFRTESPRTSIVAVDVTGSAALGGTPGPRLLTGIGSARRSTLLDSSDYDRARWIPDRLAIRFCRGFAAATGIKLGGSSGAVLAACAAEMADSPEIGCAVCVCPDFGANYESTIYNDEWLRRAGIEALDSGTPSHEIATTFRLP
jgi:2,3-diaminopropionate biosynthesis protein SbnA